MKSVFYHFEILLLLGIVSGLMCCVNESDDDFFRAEGGTISGMVLYRDYFTNQTNIAPGAEIIISSANGEYKLEANENGEFKVGFLRSSEYTAKISFTVSDDNRGSLLYLYEKRVQVPLENESFILDIDSNQDYPLSSLTGRILFNNELSDLNQVVRGTEIRLKSMSTSVNTVFTDSTDEGGNFTINNLSEGEYELDVTYYQNVGNSEPLVYKLTSTPETNELVSVSRNSDTLINDKILRLSDKDLVNHVMKVEVLKKNNNKRIPDAKVYLSEKEFDINNLDKSIVIDSTETNPRGIALFGDLEGGTTVYHVYVSVSNRYALKSDTVVVTRNDSAKFYSKEVKLDSLD